MKPRVLIVENEAIVALSLEQRLPNCGYDVVGWAAHGAEAIRMASELCPDLVLMDINLGPGIDDGIKVAQEIRRNVPTAMVYVTSYTDDETVQRAQASAPYGYLVKPFSIRELCATLETALYRYQLERRLRQSQDWLEAILKNIAEGVIAADQSGRISVMNSAAAALTGWAESEAIGQEADQVYRVLTETGDPVPEPRVGSVLNGKPLTFHGDLLLIAQDGRRRIIADSVSPIRNPRGEIAGAVVVFHDLSARKKYEAELRRTNEDLQQFTFIAAHDLQEAVRTISSHTELLRRRFNDRLDPEDSELMDFVLSGARRMGSLVEGMLLYGEVVSQEVLPSPVAASVALDRALENLRGAVAESGARIVTEPLPTVLADPNQLTAVFQNLLSNAIKFRSDEPLIVRVTQRVALAFAVFCIEDNGIGIESRHRDQVFRIFKRLEGPRAPGAGVGLALCKTIVERQGGRIWVEPAEPRGSRFCFTLPLVRA
ncbi:MAG: sensor histidine kinase [Bryobacteraceae bacterium]